ncbi:MAG: DUF2130 domain-containing protein [Acidimicrobiia bacterium]|nr:DUF2130 domain-containing protein [Acidimicrobiia bacterium]
MTKAASNRITCPHCGGSIKLDETYLRQLADGWRRETLPQLKKEILPGLREQAATEARKRLEADRRDQEQEAEDLRRQVRTLKGEITKLSRRVPTERAQQLGALHEEALAQALASKFPQDEILITGRGRAGGDVTQSVFNPSGAKVGTILWEVKRAAKWSSAWVTKLRKDCKSGRHNAGVIVSDVGRADLAPIAQIDELWRTTLELAPALSAALRANQIQLHSNRPARAQAGTATAVYEYVRGSDFGDRMRGMVQAATEMQKDLTTDKKASERRWERQEQHLQALVEEIVGVVSDFRQVGRPGVVLGIPKSELAALPAPRRS